MEKGFLILKIQSGDKVRPQFVPDQKKTEQKFVVKTKPLLGKGFNDDSDWARTSDLYPVKVALSQLSYGIGLCISSGLSVTDSLYYITIMISRQCFCSKAKSRYPHRLFTNFMTGSQELVLVDLVLV